MAWLDVRFFLMIVGKAKINSRSFATRMLTTCGVASTFALGALSSAVDAAAFSLGNPRTQSYIGQPLSVFVPIAADKGQTIDSNSLVVAKPSAQQLQSLGLDPADFRSYRYQVVRVGNRLGALVTSKEPVAEPYVNLVLQVTYQGETRIKPYPVLLDLPPSVPVVNTELNQIETQGAALPSNALPDNATTNNANSGVVTYSADIMGAYDWAQAGAIPQKFGPVIDGQSLWRVARRINKAMGVSIDQMMWGLYRANPSAFTTSSVESLQVGSVLEIPSESFVREVTEMQAVRLLSGKQQGAADSVASDANDVNNTNNAIGVGEVSNSSDTIEPTGDGSDVANNAETNASTPEFSLGGVDPTDANKDVIAALNTTVSELSEQLLLKDQRITFLEQEIEKLTGVKPEQIGGVATDAEVSNADTALTTPVTNEESAVLPEVDASDEPGFVIDQSEVPADGLTPEVDGVDASDDSSIVDETTAPITDETAAEALGTLPDDELLTTVEPIAVDSANLTVEPNNNFAETATEASFWNWKKLLLLALLALAAVAFAFRKAIQGLFSSLFSDKDEIVLNIPSVIETPSRSAAKDAAAVPDVGIQTPAPVQAIEVTEVAEDDFDDDYFIVDEESVDVEEMNLSDRIKQLLNAGNFTEAKKTIDFAQETNMDVKYLDFCRLKIYAAEDNKSDFAKTFNRVNRRINDFHPDIQLKIADLHREMFDSEAVIDFGFAND